VDHFVRPTDKKIVKITTVVDKIIKKYRSIIVTEDHLFHTTKGWIEAGKLSSRNILNINHKGQNLKLRIKSVTSVVDENILISDISVESENHTFISESGFMVHNSAMGFKKKTEKLLKMAHNREQCGSQESKLSV
jgi:hypothetical protein